MVAPPLDALARTAALYGAGLTVWVAVDATRGRRIAVTQHAAAALLWLAASAVALAHAVAALRDPAGRELALTLGYGAVALAVIPMLWPKPIGPDSASPKSDAAPAVEAIDAGRADPASRARFAVLAAAVTVVVLLRLRASW